MHWSKHVQASYDNVLNFFAYSGSALIYWSCLEMETESQPLLLRVSSVNSILSLIASVPYDMVQLKKGLNQEQWLIIAPVNNWKEKFLDEMAVFFKRK